MSLYNQNKSSDDEIFFGKMTLKEVKKRLFWNKPLKTTRAASATNSPESSGDHNESLKILEAHSQPNLIPKTENGNLDVSELNHSGLDMKATDDSFIKMENMVAQLCVSSMNNEKPELNNTLEVIEYILNNPPSSTKEKNEKVGDLRLKTKFKDVSPKKIKSEDKEQEDEAYHSPEPPQNTPIKTAHQLHKYAECYTTPRDVKLKPTFKTPAQPLSQKKASATSLKTPSRSNAYQHISSPVASYIKNCPIAPLVKDVHPKKPLPGTSSIPKIVKNLPTAKPNKENINLPSVAYKSAKQTRVIDVPDKQKLPPSHWVKKITTTLPRPLVMKHNHRELNVDKKKLPQQEDSFADLSYHQAEVSVCTQQSAFNTKKNH